MRRTIALARVLLLVSAVGCGEVEPVKSAAQGAAGSGGAPECPSEPTAPVGSDLIEGDLVIATVADAAAAQQVSEVSGTLRIAPTFPGVLLLPNLVRVGGDVYLEGHAVAGAPEAEWARITELRLPNLTQIGGQLFIYLTGALTETDLRKLETVGERVYYMRNLALRRIGLDSLQDAPMAIQASPQAAGCEIDAVCAQIGGTTCGSVYSDPNCTCEPRCGRLEPSCPAWHAGG